MDGAAIAKEIIVEREATERADMVERQLQARGIRDMRVLEAMRQPY